MNNSIKHTVITCSMILALASITGCLFSSKRPSLWSPSPSITSFDVYVKSLADWAELTKVISKRFILRSGNQNIHENDLEYKWFSPIMEAALSAHGYYGVDKTEAQSADVAIFIDFGSNSPKETQTIRSEPVYGRTSGGIQTINTALNAFDAFNNKIGTAYFSSYVNAPMQYGIIGYRTFSEIDTTYSHYLSMEMVTLADADNGSELIKLSKVTTIYAGKKFDFESVANYLALAAARNLTVNDPITRRISVSSSDKDYQVFVPEIKVVNPNKYATGYFQRYCNYAIDASGETNQAVETAIRAFVSNMGYQETFEAQSKTVLVVHYEVNDQFVRIDLLEGDTRNMLAYAQAKDKVSLGDDYFETATYALKQLANIRPPNN